MTAATRRQGFRLEDRDPVHYYYYYVRLAARNAEDLFVRYPLLKETMQQTWTAVMNVYPLVKPGLFFVTPRSFDAILCIANGFADEDAPPEEGFFHDLVSQTEGVPDLVVEKAVDFFRALCMHGIQRIRREENIAAEVGFWEDEYRVHLIESEDELERLSSQILGKNF